MKSSATKSAVCEKVRKPVDCMYFTDSRTTIRLSNSQWSELTFALDLLKRVLNNHVTVVLITISLVLHNQMFCLAMCHI